MKPKLPEAYKLFHEGTEAFARMEAAGIRVDMGVLGSTIKKCGEEIRALQAKLEGDPVYKAWKRKYGMKANLGSREQLAGVIHGVMGHKVRYRTPTGRPKTDKGAFSHIGDEGVTSFVADYFLWQELNKVKGTFLEGIRAEVVDGVLHPFFNLAGGGDKSDKGGARSYRSSSSAINFQNLPVRNPRFAEMIRGVFFPRKGYQLGEADYSGIEVMVAYFYHLDPNMKKYLTDAGTDMHRDMAVQIYKLSPKQITKAIRHAAKNRFVFPVFYGSFYVDCAKALWRAAEEDNLITADGIPLKEHLASKGITARGKCDEDSEPVPGTFEHHMRAIEKDFWGKRFGVYAGWKKKWWDLYCKRGWFDLKTGFRISGVYRRNEVINYPVQGAAFHCLLNSVIKVTKKVRKYKMRSRIVGQIHDSMVSEIHEKETQDYLGLVRDVMTKEVPREWASWIVLPLKIEAEVSPLNESWFNKAVWVENDSGVWGPKA